MSQATHEDSPLASSRPRTGAPTTLVDPGQNQSLPPSPGAPMHGRDRGSLTRLAMGLQGAAGNAAAGRALSGPGPTGRPGGPGQEQGPVAGEAAALAPPPRPPGPAAEAAAAGSGLPDGAGAAGAPVAGMSTAEGTSAPAPRSAPAGGAGGAGGGGRAGGRPGRGAAGGGGGVAAGAGGGAAAGAGVGAPVPAASEGGPGSTAAPAVAPDVAAVMDAGADPAATAAHEELLARAEGLRLASMGFSYPDSTIAQTLGVDSAVGRALLGSLLPEDAMVTAWDRLTGENVYSSEQGTIASIQSGIERFRGILAMVDQVAGAVSAIAALVAAGAALFSWLAGVGAAVAAVALQVSLIALLVSTASKALNSLLGIVQIVLNVMRARMTDDPVERARLVQQMNKEAGEFGTSLTGTVIGVLTAPVGGAGRAVSQGVRVGIRAARRVLTPLARVRRFISFGTRAAGRQAVRSVRAAAGTVVARGAGVLRSIRRIPARIRNAPQTARAFARLKRIQVSRQIPGTKLWKAQYHRKLQERLQVVRVRGRSTGLYSAEQTGEGALLRQFARQEARQVAPDAQKSLEIGRDIEKATKGGGAGDTAVGAGPAGVLGAGGEGGYAYWPGVLTRITAVRADLATAKRRMRGEYEEAAVDAGQHREAVVALQGEPIGVGSTLRTASAQQQAAAAAGRQQAEETATQAGAAEQAQTEAQQPLTEAGAAGKQAEAKSQEAQERARGEEPEDPAWYEVAAEWLYEQTLGRLFSALADIQSGISSFVLKIALSAAGLDSKDMDLAGMKSSAEADAATDKETEAAAGTAATEGDHADTELDRLKEGLPAREQAAIQGMVDAGSYLSALEDYDQALAEHESEGAEYVEEVGADLAAQEEAGPAQEAPAIVPPAGPGAGEPAEAGLVTAEQVDPIIDGATELGSAAEGAPGRLQAAGLDAVALLASQLAARGAPPGPALECGEQMVADAVAAATEQHGTVAGQAAALVASVQGLVGTGDLDGVQAGAHALEQLTDHYLRLELAGAASINEGLEAIVAAYLAVANEETAPEETAPEEAVAAAAAGAGQPEE